MEQTLLVISFLLTTSRKKINESFFYEKLMQVFIREMAWVLV